ncbi:nucleopolyhedrovirus P10 family protein [Streptomyces sp. YIM S03343]
MTTERWARTVRGQLGLGRLLALGGPRDGAWITEDAARDALRRAAADVVGVRLDALRITLADPEDTHDPVVPAPPSALPPGPLRVTADFAAIAVTAAGAMGGQPLPVVAARLRAALAGASEWVGLAVAEVDLRVTDLLDEETPRDDTPGSGMSEADTSAVRVRQAPEADSTDPDEVRAAEAALSVPGVARLTNALGGLGGHPVHIERHPADANALPRRHARVEITVTTDARAVEVARAVRSAVGGALHDAPTVAVLVTGVEEPEI